MTLKQIRDDTRKIEAFRKQVEAAEQGLVLSVNLYLDQYEETMRSLARKLGVSAQYLCDIRHARRKVSGPLIEKLARLPRL